MTMEPIDDCAPDPKRCFECGTVLGSLADGVVLCAACARVKDEIEPIPETLRLPRWWYEDPSRAKPT
jgi:hypothetical protein